MLFWRLFSLLLLLQLLVIYSHSRKGKGDSTDTDANKCVSGNCRNGHGIFSFAGGSTYAGEWKDGKRSGRGVENQTGGATYEGMWKGDKRNRIGAQTVYKDGKPHIAYLGEWTENDMTGCGLQVTPKGKFFGYWKSGKLQEEVPRGESCDEDKIMESVDKEMTAARKAAKLAKKGQKVDAEGDIVDPLKVKIMHKEVKIDGTEKESVVADIDVEL